MQWIKDTDNGISQLDGLQTIIDYIQEEIHDSKKKDKLLDELWHDLYKWKIISPDQDWTVKLPHLYNFFKEYKNV
jgi:hypothetical protein